MPPRNERKHLDAEGVPTSHPYIAANRRVTIMLMRAELAAPVNFRPPSDCHVANVSRQALRRGHASSVELVRLGHVACNRAVI
jgi:hypothetical protein